MSGSSDSGSGSDDDDHEAICIRRFCKADESVVPAAYLLGPKSTEASVRARDLRRDRRDGTTPGVHGTPAASGHQEASEATDDGLVDTLHRWVSHHASSTSSAQGRVPIAYVYADGVHNSDAAGPFDELAARLGRSGAVSAALLGPADFNGKQSMAAFARTLLLRARPDAQPPVACTLQTLLAALSAAPTGRAAPPKATSASIALLVTDLEAVHPSRLCTAVSALHAARAAGLRACIVAAMSTSPALVLPRLPARLQAITATSVYKLQAPRAAMDAALWRSQAELRPSGALLGGGMLRWASRHFLELDFSAAALPTTLRWAALRHSLHAAPAALLPALLSGDDARLERACRAAREDVLDALLATPTRGTNKHKVQAAKAADVLQHLQTLRRHATTSHIALHALHAAAAAAGTLPSFQARLWLIASRARGALRSTGAPVDTARGAIGLADQSLADFLHSTCAHLARAGDDKARALACTITELVGTNELHSDVTDTAADIVTTLERLASAPSPTGPTDDASGEAAAAQAAHTAAAAAATPPAKAARRTHRQSAGAFLTAQASAAETGAAAIDVASKGAPARRSLGAQVAAAVGGLLLHALQRPPCACPCALVLFYDDVGAATAALCPAPRLDMHRALLSGAHCGRLAKARRSAGPPRESPDVCTAYGHLVTFGASIDLGAWFRAFCAAHGVCGAAAVAAPKRSRGAARKRKKAKTVERRVEGAAAAAAGDEGGAREEGAGGEEEEVDAAAVREMAARFSQAVAELQRMGLVSRGGRGARGALQRTAFPPDLS